MLSTSSTYAATKLMQAANKGDFAKSDKLMGTTDCPHGCVVEFDGWCAHGYKSAGITAGFIL
jgi:hypothetical protein